MKRGDSPHDEDANLSDEGQLKKPTTRRRRADPSQDDVSKSGGPLKSESQKATRKRKSKSPMHRALEPPAGD